MPEIVWLTGSGLTVETIAKVAREEASMAPTQDVLTRLSRARAILDEAAASGQKIYGLNTGLGANLGASVVDPDDFQLALVRGRGMAFGPAYGREETRAIMAARLAMLSTGGSGISPGVFAGLADMLAAAIHPVMPSIGSTGASDLVLLSALAQALAGEGMVEHRGEIVPADAALARAGLEKQSFAPKDGLSLISASAVSVGCGALLGDEARTMLRHQRRAIALSFEGLGGNPSILQPQIQAARPAAGQRDEARLISALLEGSSLYDAQPAIQDPLSLRCAASVSGALSRALDTFVGDVETELNSSGDNPVVLLEERAVLSTGNFHVPALALSTEALGLAIGQAALASAARFIHLTGGTRTGLPRYLSPLGGASAGFVPLQKSVAALCARIRRNAVPVMLDVVPVSEGVEDQATNAPLAVEKCREIVRDWRYLVACEMLAGAQAAELRGQRCGTGSAACLEDVRSVSPFLTSDRPLGPDVERLASLLGRLQG